MFSCSQNSRKPVIQNIINNYANGSANTGTGGGNVDLSPLYTLIYALQSQFNILESSLNNFSFDLSHTRIISNSDNIDISNSDNIYYLDLSDNLNLSNISISNELLLNNSTLKLIDICGNTLSINIPLLDSSYNLKFPKNIGNQGQVLKLDQNGELIFSDISALKPIIQETIITQENFYDKRIEFKQENYSLNESLNIIKEGIIINYFIPPSTFYSSRNTYNINEDYYMDIDNSEKEVYEYIIEYLNDKNLLNMTNLNLKSFISYQSQENMILNYIDSFYRSNNPVFLNILSNDYYLKVINKANYCIDLIKNLITDNRFKNYNINFYNYIVSLYNDKLINKINYNEVPILCPINLIPPYYMESLGNTDIKPKYDSSYTPLYTFGNIEYEQNIAIIEHINKNKVNNLTFYIYVQNTIINNDIFFVNSLSIDNSLNSNNIYNIINNSKTITDYIKDNSDNNIYDYGNLMFILDNSSILHDLSVDNIYIPDLNQLQNIYNDISNFNILDIDTKFNIDLSNNIKKNSSNITTDISFEEFNLINLNKLSYNGVSNIQQSKNNIIFCPIKDNPFDFEMTNSGTSIYNNQYKYTRNAMHVESLYKYLTLMGYFKTRNDFSLNVIISTNQTDTTNILLIDNSINNLDSFNKSLLSNMNIYLTYYDNINKIPNYLNDDDKIFKNIYKLSDYDASNNKINELLNIIIAYEINKNNNLNNKFLQSVTNLFSNLKSLNLALHTYIILYITESIYKNNIIDNNYVNFLLQKINPYESYKKIRYQELGYYDNSSVLLIDNIFSNNIYLDISNQNIFDPNINFYRYKDKINYNTFSDLSDNLSFRDMIFLVYNSYNSNNPKLSNIVNYNYNKMFINKINSHNIKEFFNKKVIEYDNINTVNTVELNKLLRNKLLKAWNNFYSEPFQYLTI